MKNLTLSIDDDLDTALTAACLVQGRDRDDLVSDLVRQFLDKESLRQKVQRADWINLYSELAEEDVALAESGLGDYAATLLHSDEA